MRVVETRQSLQRELRDLRSDGSRIGLVMTMGALHEGHLSLVRRAQRSCDRVVVTIFVNPTQFGEGEDLDRYPRQLEADLAALDAVGADLVYTPSVQEVYPKTPRVTLTPGRAARTLEGAQRPGHFSGVLQIVCKVLNLVRPDVAIFGQKDAQQFANISQMVEDLDMGVDLVEAPVVRDERGLALSSRNAYLSGEQKGQALALSRALARGRRSASRGASAREVVGEVAALLLKAPGVQPLYVAVARRETFEVVALWSGDGDRLGTDMDLVAPLAPLPEDGDESAGDLASGGEAYLLVAAKVGTVRLIDNAKIQVSDGH